MGFLLNDVIVLAKNAEHLVARDHGAGVVPRARAVFQVSADEGALDDASKPSADARRATRRRSAFLSRPSRVRQSLPAKGSVQAPAGEQAFGAQIFEGGEESRLAREDVARKHPFSGRSHAHARRTRGETARGIERRG